MLLETMIHWKSYFDWLWLVVAWIAKSHTSSCNPYVCELLIYLLARGEQYWYMVCEGGHCQHDQSVLHPQYDSRYFCTSTLNVRIKIKTSTLSEPWGEHPLMLRNREINLSFFLPVMCFEPWPLVWVCYPLHHRLFYLVRCNDVFLNVAQFVGRVTVICPTLSEKFLKYFWLVFETIWYWNISNNLPFTSRMWVNYRLYKLLFCRKCG